MTYEFTAGAQGLYLVWGAGRLVGRIINRNKSGRWYFRREDRRDTAGYQGREVSACLHQDEALQAAIAAEMEAAQ